MRIMQKIKNDNAIIQVLNEFNVVQCNEIKEKATIF